MKNNTSKKPEPDYPKIHYWEFYPADLWNEYRQSVDEGLDIEKYQTLFDEIAKLPNGKIKKEFGDVIFELISAAETRPDYKYKEPSDLEEIKALRQPYSFKGTLDKNRLESKIAGAWFGRICGCMLGKSIEGIKSPELERLLKQSGNYPMHRYILKSDIDRLDLKKFKFDLKNRPYADIIDGMPADDDTNYTFLAQKIIEKHGRDFIPENIPEEWIASQPKSAYCTAERVAFCNFLNGYQPPFSAFHKNPYREWIGAQIRTDYYGYINPGDPEAAAETAWRDATVSHTKNGIYGAMFAAAMLATAAVTQNTYDIIMSGISQIPASSRLYENVLSVIDGYKNGVSKADCFAEIHKKFDENTEYGWCHTIPNSMIVAASLLYGNGDYSKSICMAVETAFDTDCNAATVGSVLGMANGIESIPMCWREPIGDKLHTSCFGAETVSINELIQKTLLHIEKN